MRESEQRLRNTVDLKVRRVRDSYFICLILLLLCYLSFSDTEQSWIGLRLGGQSQGQSSTDCYRFSDILQVATGFRMLFRSFSDVLQAGQAYGRSYGPQGTCKGFGEV
jgi:hypothetical protein